MAILILLSVLTIVGLILWLSDRKHRDTIDTTDNFADDNTEPCCGMHITCQKDSLLTSVSDTIEYYDDYELDRFAGRQPDEYSDADIEEFRDILLTLRPDDIAGWGRSIQLRNIQLPPDVRDELLLIVAEARRSVQ